MIRYNETSQRLWLSRDFLALSDRAKLLWMFLLTGPIKTNLAGLYNAGIGTCTDHLRVSTDVFKRAFAELEERGMAEACWETNVIYLPRWIHHNRGPSNPNVLKGWLRVLSAIPDGMLKEKYVEDLKVMLVNNGSYLGMLDVWSEDNPIEYIPIVDGDDVPVPEVKKKNLAYVTIAEEYTTRVIEILNPAILSTPVKRGASIAGGADELRKLIEVDKVSVESVKEALEWVIESYDPSSSFSWLPNLISLASLRKKSKTNRQTKFDNILSSMESSTRKQSSGGYNKELFS